MNRRQFCETSGLGVLALCGIHTAAACDETGALVMADPFIGQIVMFAGNFAPRDWALCDGQLLQIAQNTALFSILGTTYGGDGRTTFALPDLRGRTPIHEGQGPGLANRPLGSKGGAESVTLNAAQIPSHNHNMNVTKDADSQSPIDKVLARAPDQIYGPRAPGDNQTLASDAVTNTGGGQAHPNMQPFLTLNFIIALRGTFPSRS